MFVYVFCYMYGEYRSKHGEGTVVTLRSELFILQRSVTLSCMHHHSDVIALSLKEYGGDNSVDKVENDT